MLKDTVKVKRIKRPPADWRKYEEEKQRVREVATSPAEYEKQIREIVNRLGV